MVSAIFIPLVSGLTNSIKEAMYIPSKYKQENIDSLIKIMQEYSFANLIAISPESQIEAHHLPVVLFEQKEKLKLKAHINKANLLYKNVKDGSMALVIFNGPNCYISPNLYPTKKINGKAVPTWNYVAVHVKGKISFIHDNKWLYNQLDELTNKHEKNQSSPWFLSDAPQSFINQLLLSIVGIEIEIDSIEGQFKLSQDKPDINYQGLIDGLAKNSDYPSLEVLSMMKKFPKK